MGSKVYRRQVCMSPTHREVPKTNGHSVSLPTSIIPELHSSPRLGRPLNLRSYGMPRYSLHLVFWLVKKYSPFPKSCFLLYNLSLYCKPFSVHVWFPHFHFVSAVFLVVWQTAPAPAYMRRLFQSKWCRAQRTAPHLATSTGPGTIALHRRSDVRTVRKYVISSQSVVVFVDSIFLLCLSSLFMKRRRRSTGSFWPWSLVVSHLSFTTAAHMPLWGHTEICTYTNAIDMPY